MIRTQTNISRSNLTNCKRLFGLYPASPRLRRHFFATRSFGKRTLGTGKSVTKRFFNFNETFFAIASIIVTIPTAVWLYKSHYRANNDSKPIESSTSNNTALGNTATTTHHEQPDFSAQIRDGQPAKLTSQEAEEKELEKFVNELIGDSPKSTNQLEASQKDSTAALGDKQNLYAKYLLVGGGAASFSAMEAILEQEPTADIMIISNEAYPPYMRPPLSKELWFNKDDSQTNQLLFTDWRGKTKPIQFQPITYFETENIASFHPSKVRLLLGTKASWLNTKDKTVGLQDGKITVKYDKVLLATGGVPKRLEVVEKDAETAKGILTLRGINDFQTIHAIAHNPNLHIAIVGGGFVGSEMAIALASYGKAHHGANFKVTQLFPEDGNMALVFPKYLSTWTTSRLRKEGVNVIPNCQISKVSPEEGGSRTILSLSNGKDIAVDNLLVAVGIEPSIELAKHAGLPIDAHNGGIMTDSRLRIAADVYGAGDVISFVDESLDKRRRIEHYDHAILSGKLAGRNMVSSAGESKFDEHTYDYQSMFWSDLGPEVGYEAVGLVDSKLTTVGIWAHGTFKDTPKGTDMDPADIREMPIGQIGQRLSGENDVNSKVDAYEMKAKPTDSSPEDDRFRKGLVLYLDGKRIVGVLMFNLFNRIALARDVIKQNKSVDDLQQVVKLFNIYEEQ